MKENLQRNIGIVFRNHYRELCLLSYSYVSCPDLAQDIVQDTFVKILTNEEASEISNLKGYIGKSVKHASLKQIKRSKKLTPLHGNTPVFTLPEEAESIDVDLGPKLRSAIDQLPGQCKTVFELCALDGQKYRTAANSLGISVNTVKTQMKKAYRILRYDLRNVYGIVLFFGIIHQLLP